FELTIFAKVLHGRDLSGNVAIVTGASAGIGVETARSLAHHGCHVIMACRSRNKTQAVIDNIHEFRPNAKLDFLELDLASMKSVKEFAENFKAQFQRLDYLILNAGIFMVPFARTEDGFELTFQVNHLSQMYLTLLLRDILIKTPMARVVAVSSESHRFTRLTTSNISQEYLSPNSSSKHWSMMAYNLSKLHNILFTNALNRRLAPHGVCCNAVHPGNLVYTELSRSSWFMRVLFFAGRPFTKTLQQGAATTIYAAVAPELQGVGGQYFNNCFLTKPHAKALDVDLQEKLWTVSIEMIRSCMGNIDDVPPHPDVNPHDRSGSMLFGRTRPSLLGRAAHRFGTHSGRVRVRFAPSPTGFLHLGGLRTALYNFLFARAKGGAFVLRIEDTDRSRLVPDAAQRLVETLDWLGLAPDEGPGVGGAFGPYVQSERIHIYRFHADELLKTGRAYPCFCSEHRLDLLRKEQLRNREVVRYDNRCRKLSAKEVQRRLLQGDPHCFRLKLEEEVEDVVDMLHGRISYAVHKLEGDPVLLKADGYPTYHLANVIDDHLMAITHVLRGCEWLVSTPKHAHIYRAFGWEMPAFAHLPLILNSDGSKLSKRQGDVYVEEFRSKGFYPEALLSFITEIGGGFRDREDVLHSLDDLITKFAPERLNANSCRLKFERLEDLNRQALEKKISDPKERCLLVSQLKDLLQHHGFYLREGDEWLSKVLAWSLPRVTRLSDLASPPFHFLWTSPDSHNAARDLSPVQRSMLEEVEVYLKLLPSGLNKEEMGFGLKHLAQCFGFKYSHLMHTLRIALSGLQEGPSILEILDALGKEESLRRISKVLRH
ncbi:unnamed protein product, partial [Darwinula stevensoni]